VTIVGVVLIDLLAVAFLAWILGLVQQGRLYVGYGVILVATLVAVATVVSVPVLRAAVDAILQRLFGTAGPLVVAFSFVTLLLIYILTQVTIVSNRLATLVQDLAIRQADAATPRKSDAPEGNDQDTGRANTVITSNRLT